MTIRNPALIADNDSGNTVVMSDEQRCRQAEENENERLIASANNALDSVLKALSALMLRDSSDEARSVIVREIKDVKLSILRLVSDEIDEEEGKVGHDESIKKFSDLIQAFSAIQIKPDDADATALEFQKVVDAGVRAGFSTTKLGNVIRNNSEVDKTLKTYILAAIQQVDTGASPATVSDDGDKAVTVRQEKLLRELTDAIGRISGKAPSSRKESTPAAILKQYEDVIQDALRKGVMPDQIREKYNGEILRLDRDVTKALDDILLEENVSGCVAMIKENFTPSNTRSQLTAHGVLEIYDRRIINLAIAKLHAEGNAETAERFTTELNLM